MKFISFHTFLLLIIFIGFFSCKKNGTNAGITKNISLENGSDNTRNDEIVSIPLDDIQSVEMLKTDQWLSVPSQKVDLDVNGEADHLQLLLNFTPNETKNIALSDLLSEDEIKFPKRTQAEISHKINGEWKDREYLGGSFKNVTHLDVPPEHTDHSWYIRYEGPGWESDKVGYRFYLDWRNATDIFGKKTEELVLQNVGQDGFDSYHEEADWGMDVLKVGESLGIGSIGMWVNGKAERIAKTDSLEATILDNGPIFSRVRTIYHGWEIDDLKIDLTSDLSIKAGSRMTHEEIMLSENLENLCTGIVKHPEAELFEAAQKGKSGWGYIATYGKQTLNNDMLGMAIIFKNEDLLEITEDEHSHVVVLMPKHRSLDYYFLAAWELEKDGIQNKNEFIDYLNQQIEALNRPIEINIQ